VQYQLITPTAKFDRKVTKTAKSLGISDELLETGIREMMAVGSADSCTESLEKFVKAGASHIHVQAYGGDRRELGLIAKKIIPNFRK
jgi:hypothetical protein